MEKGVSLRRLEQIGVALAELELSHWLESVELGKGNSADTTQPKTVRELFERLGGAFLKLGQLLALRPDLVGTAYSKEFEKLLQDVLPEPWADIERVIAKHVPGGLRAFSHVSEKPIAAGSIAQVHRGVLKDGTVVAIKVKRPGVDGRFASDIALMRMLARRYVKKHGTAVVDATAIVEEFANYTQRELTMSHELRNIQRFALNFKHSAVKIPKTYAALSSDEVLVMEFLNGNALFDMRGMASAKRQQVVRMVVNAAYQQLFVDGFFHADLHGGNIFVLEDGKIGLLDFGIVGYVDHELKRNLLELFRALSDGDLEATARVLIALNIGSEEPNLQELQEGLYFSLGSFYGAKLGDIPVGKVLLECIEVARRSRLKLPAQLVLFAKSIVTLEGVCAALDPKFDILTSAKPFIRKMEHDAMKPERMMKSAKEFGLLSVRAIAKLPSMAGKIDHHLHTLDDRVTDIDETFRYLAHTILRVSKLLVAALLFAATLLTSALLMRTEPQWHGISIYTLAGAAASLLLLFFIIELMRRKP